MRKGIGFAWIVLTLVLTGCGNRQPTSTPDPPQQIAWIPFVWEADSLGGRYYDKLGIKIPITINDSIDQFAQFDLGANTDMLYESTLAEYTDISHDFTVDTVGTESSYYWIRNPNITIGSVQTVVQDWVVRTTYDAEGVIGTIGAEELKNRSLILDFPHTQMAILDSVPKSYRDQFEFFDFETRNNKVILTVTINGKKQRANFDTGSSITPLFVTDSVFFHDITDAKLGTDTLREFASWGTTFDYIPGASIKESFVIGNRDFGHQTVYYLDSDYHRNLFTQDSIVALVGSIVYFEDEILIDFEHQQMGVKTSFSGQ